MELRLPWILSRKRLISAVAVDTVIFVIAFLSIDYFYNSALVTSSLFIFLSTFWLLGSYVLGRFVSGGSKSKYIDLRAYIRSQLLATTTLFVLIVFFTLIYLCIFDAALLDALHLSILIKFLLLLAISSCSAQYLHFRLISSRSPVSNTLWFFVGPEDTYDELKSLLRWSRISVNLKNISPSDLHLLNTGQFIVKDLTSESPEVLENLQLV